MKERIIFLILLLSSSLFYAQDTANKAVEFVPFAVIDEVPVFPGCEELEANEQKKCIQHKIQKHVARKFNTELANILGLLGKKRTLVLFLINKEGNVENIQAKGPHPALEDEAIRVVKLLPKMIPGKHNGKPVDVKYALPITLLAEGYGADNFNTINDNSAPIFPGCESLAINLQKKCFKDKVTAHIEKNLNRELAKKLDLGSRKKVVYANFKIDSNGKIKKVNSLGSHKILEEEAERVINLLPQMKPREANEDVPDKVVDYYLQVNFNN